jgi:hypothetical protein
MKLSERIRQRMIDDPIATGVRHIVIVRLIMADELPRQITGGRELCTCPWCANTRPAVWWQCSCRYHAMRWVLPIPFIELSLRTILTVHGLRGISWFEIDALCPHHGDAAYEARLPPWTDKLLAEDGEL